MASMAERLTAFGRIMAALHNIIGTGVAYTMGIRPSDGATRHGFSRLRQRDIVL